jgi:hypothetical protein
MLALAGIGASAPKVSARAGSSFTILFGRNFFMAQM